jgi:hypothetical protein
MKLQDALLKLHQHDIDCGIFEGDEDWIIGSVPIHPSLQAQLPKSEGAIKARFSICPNGQQWSMVISGPGMIDVTIATKNMLEELLAVVVEFYLYVPSEINIFNDTQQAVELLKKSGLLAETAGDVNIRIFGGTHVITEGKQQVYGNIFAIFLHSTKWVAVLINADKTSSLIKYSPILNDVVRAVINYFRENTTYPLLS